ncbi:hypothetical protein TEA_014496 [Camellia sinensis var. sinensis]|uniref:Disease resistance protein At4g27190-like leucine-rich repeats domain-containing protein n=1 Tax=Camellia sinensis var. sinensis TaxID=542762 RepID=A0A4S4D763_CAMSN|nr:hypothetical protein TEA_014496 [Camellia sinensis var. sinensis]
MIWQPVQAQGNVVAVGATVYERAAVQGYGRVSYRGARGVCSNGLLKVHRNFQTEKLRQQMIELMQISQASLTQGDQKPWVRALCTELHSGNLYRPVKVFLAEGLTVKHQYGRTSKTEPNIRDCSTNNKLKGIPAGGAGHPIRGCRISWLRKFKHSRYRHLRQKRGRDLWEIGAEALSKSESGVELIAIEKLLILSMHNVIEIWPGKLLEKLRDVIIFRCPKLLNILFPSNLIKGMQSLEQVRVEYCQSVEVVFDLEGVIVRKGYSDSLLPSLTQLLLLYLPKLTHVWKDNLPRIQGFQNLTSLIISGCGNLRNIFSPSQARLLVKLQKIKVAECGVLEAIIGEEPKVDDEVAADIIMFPQLSSLELYHLPSLRSICPQAYTVEGSFLKKIEVINCPNMKALPSAFQGIPELQESNVQKVDFFGSAQHHLWDGNVRLKVWWCGSLEMIFDLQEGVCASASASSSGGAGEEETSITPLDFLELKYLPKLMHIWKNVSQEIHCFENLTSLTVECCDNLRYIFTIFMANLLVNLEDLYIRHCEKVEKIVTKEMKKKSFCNNFPMSNLPILCFGPDINDIQILVSHSTVNFCLKFAGGWRIYSISMKIKKLEKIAGNWGHCCGKRTAVTVELHFMMHYGIIFMI